MRGRETQMKKVTSCKMLLSLAIGEKRPLRAEGATEILLEDCGVGSIR